MVFRQADGGIGEGTLIASGENCGACEMRKNKYG